MPNFEALDLASQAAATMLRAMHGFHFASAITTDLQSCWLNFAGIRNLDGFRGSSQTNPKQSTFLHRPDLQ